MGDDCPLEPSSFIPVKEVIVDSLAVLKIVKHCNENLPTMVAGSILGLDMDGVLEVTCVYPFPSPQPRTEGDGGEVVDEVDGGEYQLEMLKMLQKMNFDNNCVGWYTSMYLGSMSSMDVVNYQFNYQSSEELSDNCVVIMYDPIQSRHGSLVLKAFRLSDQFIEMRKRKLNEFLKPSDILVEIPVRIRSCGHVSAFVMSLKDQHPDVFESSHEAFSMVGADGFSEKHLELMGSLVDDLVQEQVRFQAHAKACARPRQEQLKWLHKRLAENAQRKMDGESELPLENKEMKFYPDAPPRGDSLLALGQLKRYCTQLNNHLETTRTKLELSADLNGTSSCS